MTTSDHRGRSKKPSSNKTAIEIQILKALFSGVSRGFQMPVNRFGHLSYVPKLMKNSYEKISLNKISGNKIIIAIKKLALRYLCFFIKAIKTVFIFRPGSTSNFALSLIRILHIVIGFDVP